MSALRRLLPLFLLLLAATAAEAQIGVDLSIKRRLFIAHEPIIATVTIINQSGRDIDLADTPELPWFSFHITGANNRIFPPRNPNYALEPLTVKAGGQMRRTVNLTELYEIGDYGIYRVRASIYFGDTKRFFSSKTTNVEITDGRLLWSSVVGIPDGNPGGGTLRKFSLLSHQHAEHVMLYVRVIDRDEGTVYCTQELGPLIDGQPPVTEFDRGNNLYVLQLLGQRQYQLTKIGVNGEFLGATRYTAPKARPYFRKLADGQLQIVGARREATAVAQSEGGPAEKLSQRPPGLPAN